MPGPLFGQTRRLSSLHPGGRVRARAAAAVLVFSMPAATWAQVPRGPEFQVNVYTTHTQGSPAVSADGAGNFVIAWSSYTQDGSHYGIFGRRHDRLGVPVGSAEFRANAYTTGRQSRPAVAAAPDGSA